MATIFSKIIDGEIPCYKLAEDEHYFAFLDINPLSRGHALVVPKQEVDYIFDLDPDTLAGLIRFSQRLALAIEKVVTCERIGVAVVGLEVPHAHIHLVPINGVHDIDFSKPRVELTVEQYSFLAGEIASSFM